ncbi:stage V sporulation protein AD [Candidatus Formimonas warabiya]|uniref:Stage V sporulation protein AD n=1 Tax=Formimonas warabiya TaxID=1761012 RepID=A0A3G1KNN9_FORW1|nr:stage V sporulation protein AD [Candidatus Formimonas warabiya]ATW24079.1 stage V sporulation protein AD [Candidatus Formimonas warabiya]
MKRAGKQTLIFQNPPAILSSSAVVGPKEGEGPLKKTFDLVMKDTLCGEKSWEKAECKILQEAVKIALNKVDLKPEQVDFLLAGDLLNQTISANYAARQLAIPFLGLYGACSTMIESMILGSVLVDGGYADTVVAAASSHHDTAERQYRFPSELGVQRPLTAQWTVTGAGACLIAKGSGGPRITSATIGKVIDLGIKDQNDMGSAMAPAAVDTITQHFQDTGHSMDDFDLIITGDLASLGKALAQQLLERQGYLPGDKYSDCGILIFDPTQDTHAGGSGCACSAVVTCGYLMQNIRSGRYKRMMVIGTGALLSPVSLLQGESIPGIAHGIVIENENGYRDQKEM